MQIVYPYQARRLRGLGAICDVTPGCACKGEILPLYEEAERVRNEIDGLMGQYSSFVPDWIRQRHDEQNRQHQILRDGFNAADERCYGNWKAEAEKAKREYEKTLTALNDHLTRMAAQINAAGGGSSAAESSVVSDFLTPSQPLIPGTPAGLNPWIIAGTVGVAIFIGYKLMTKVK